MVLVGVLLALTILGWFYTPYDPNQIQVTRRFTPQARNISWAQITLVGMCSAACSAVPGFPWRWGWPRLS